jgi:signal transduction histidine kinase
MAAERLVLREQTELKQELSDLASGLNGLSTELQEISRGIHPAILSEGGLGPALKALARRSTLPVSFEVAIERRLSDAVEIAAYYVVAEALTNAAKHAQASQVNVRAEIADSTLRLSIQDDGIGGADFRKGSGLIGLKDRVEALGGQLKVTSQPGSGTSLDIAIRLDDDVE